MRNGKRVREIRRTADEKDAKENRGEDTKKRV